MGVVYQPITGKYDGLTTQRGSFVTVGLKLTNRCNLDCYHCCRYGDYPDMELSSARTFIDSLADADVARLHFTGGEPLLHRNLQNAIGYAGRKTLKSGGKFSLSISTNGVLLTPELAHTLAPYLDSVKVSAFGIGPNYNAVTGRNGSTYSRALQGIANAVAAGIPIHVQTSVLRENIGDLAGLARLSNDLGASKVTLYSNIRQARGFQLTDEREVSDAEISQAFDRLVEEQIKSGWASDIRWRRWPNDGQYLLVFSNGELTANPVDNPPQNFEVVGNLLEDSVDDLWQRYKHQEAHVQFYADR
jgi:MoaA/NifB/PqqE/SkfB family radical SAM enzyme|tara:strand:- start:10101 stop:11009 length:909 start_codon:yes stop_codon:yes gene_type:complete